MGRMPKFPLPERNSRKKEIPEMMAVIVGLMFSVFFLFSYCIIHSEMPRADVVLAGENFYTPSL